MATGSDEQRIARALGLSADEFADLVRTQPGDVSSRLRLDVAATVVAVLLQHVAFGVIAEIVRRPTSQLAGRTILDGLRDDPERTAAAVVEAFDWSGTA